MNGEDPTFQQWLFEFITSIETLIAVLIGGGIGLLANLVIIKKEREQKEKDFKRKKLEDIYRYLSNLINEEYDLYDKILHKMFEGTISFKDMKVEVTDSFTETQLLVNLYHKELDKDFNTINNKSIQVNDIRRKFVKFLLDKKKSEEADNNIDGVDELTAEYRKKISEMNDSVLELQEKISNMAEEYI